jgi:hypothetical protein
MQQNIWRACGCWRFGEVDPALDNCPKVLVHTRWIGLPVAFIRMLNESAFFNRGTPSVRWIEGFEPYRDEMVFERVRRAGEAKSWRHRAGRIGQPVDFDRCAPPQPSGHYLSDTSASYALEEMSADDVRRAVSKLLGIHGDVYETTDWIASTLPCKFGHRKNAGG